MAGEPEGVLWRLPCRCSRCLHPPAPTSTPDADGVDRISALPDDLLRDVVARLPARDGARTAALASRWRGLWRSAPLALRDADDEPARAAAIGRALADHPGPFRAVHLTRCAFASPERQRQLAEWARHLAAKGVRDLALLNLAQDDGNPIVIWPLPVDIVRCASLRRLNLSFWAFPDSAEAEAFPHLKELRMCRTYYTTDRYFDHMLASSPELENLELFMSEMPSRIRLVGQRLRCVHLFMSMAEELAVVDAPRLERLVMRIAFSVSGGPMKVKIDRAPELRVLGYLVPKFHKLQIGNAVIKADTEASPGSTAPSVKILALKANFGALEEINMLPAFLRCFPNVETLHIESATTREATTSSHNAKFWREVRPIECLKSHVKIIVIHYFRGDQSEFEFLKFIAKHAEKLQALLLVLTDEKLPSDDEIDEIDCQLDRCTWAAEEAFVRLQPRVEDSSFYERASDLSVNDPFM